ncbi:MAG: hypothetical protein LBP23_09800 [Treponema sp.]|jgi:hypothetical protein|nr:hypothetical protein [Treponema sp.]
MKNLYIFCFFACLLIFSGCFQPVDIGETYIEKATAHLRVTNNSEDDAYILEGLELRNAEGAAVWEGLGLGKGETWEANTEIAGAFSLWYRVKDTWISASEVKAYNGGQVEIALNRSHEFLFKGETIGITQQDEDRDGLPDAWELENGFDPENPGDGGTVHVKYPGGRDDAPGNGTRDNPYKTLAKAVAKAGRGLNDDARTVVVQGTLSWANGGNGTDNPEYKGRADSVFSLGKTRNPVTIRGDGAVLTADGSGGKRVLYLGPGANIALMDITITKGRGTGGGIFATGAELSLGPGATVEYNNNNGTNDLTGIVGGGVYMELGVLTMETGSSVSNNKANSGGGIRLAASDFYMRGGAITNNDVTASGGGLYSETGGTVEMFEGALISGNLAGTAGIKDGSNGGGVTVNGDLTMHGGSKIINNKLRDGFGGGGVYVTGEGTVLTMEGGSIISCNVNTYLANENDTGKGGGVMVSYSASLIMESGAVISGNTAGKTGGGLFLSHEGTSFTMKPGAIIYGKDANGNKNIAEKSEKTDTGHAIYDNRPGINRHYSDDVTSYP